MLMEFSVTNFRSIRDTQTLSMAASHYFKEMSNTNCFNTGVDKLPDLLRSAAIYGANASGKSNLLNALSFMQNMVLNSAKDIQEGEGLPITPFLLDKESKDKPSEFEICFIEGAVRYQYGVALNKHRVVREWLIAFPQGRPQRWFDREFNPLTNEDEFVFGSRFAGGRLRQDWKNATRSNALFLSVSVQFNSEQLRPVFSWFQKRLHIVRASNFIPQITSPVCTTAEGKNKVLNFLRNADLNIADIKVQKEKLTFKFSEDGITDDRLKKFFDLMEGEEIDKILFLHKNTETGDLIPFDSAVESSGTRNLFAFAGHWIDMTSEEQVLVVDEIDTSLHPLVVHQIVRLLHVPGNKAQLIFTTHDTTILSEDIMRRDQIWFIERDASNASKLYPLSDFKVRGMEALEKGYLKGRYGAVPLVNPPIKL